MEIVYVPIDDEQLTTEMRDYDVSGYLTSGNILSHIQSSNGEQWISVKIYYDCYGKKIKRIVTIPKKNIVKTGKYISKHFYHRSSNVHATKFFNKNFKNFKNVVKYNDRRFFGSGIYGNTVFEKNSTKIIGKNLYQIQSSHHLDMLTICSINTQKYFNNLLLDIGNNINRKYIINTMNSSINSENIESIYSQWNIFFAVNNEHIEKDKLKEIILNYVLKFKIDTLFDDNNNEPIFYLIVNDIMMYQGYDGIISDVSDILYPCVLFDYSDADKISID